MSLTGVVAIMLGDCKYGIGLSRNGCVILHLPFLNLGTSNK